MVDDEISKNVAETYSQIGLVTNTSHEPRRGWLEQKVKLWACDSNEASEVADYDSEQVETRSKGNAGLRSKSEVSVEFGLSIGGQKR